MLSTYLDSVEKTKASRGIAYGGRGPRSALQNRIGLDKTTGHQQFERQYFQYPVDQTELSAESFLQ